MIRSVGVHVIVCLSKNLGKITLWLSKKVDFLGSQNRMGETQKLVIDLNMIFVSYFAFVMGHYCSGE